ncbi:MAG: extracellular solute-binding protein [Ruminococcaceae bacterium]|nr:extracellular solute-binding protein [Oscillospiraceae bacterium]
MKKILALLLAVTIVLSMGMMAGCSGSNNRNAGEFVVPEEGYDGSAVEITFYHTMGAALRDVLDKYILKFNEMYPNITIKHSQVGGYDDVRDQIKTEITVGSQPDIAYCYPDHVALYNKARAVATLDGLIDSQIKVKDAKGNETILGLTAEQKADFIEGYYNEGKSYGDGLMYTMPMSKSTEVLYYNKTFFDKHGLTVPKTWKELEETCAKIKEIDPDSIPLGYDSEANWFITMCEQYGSPYTSATGDHYLFNNDKNKEFVKMFREWYQKGYLTTQELYGAYTSGLFTATEGSKSYMSIGSTGGANHQRPGKDTSGEYLFDVGIAQIPQVDASKPKVISQGPSLVLFKNAANPQKVVASWLFVKYLTTTVEFQAEFSMTSGYAPVLKSVDTIPAYADFLANANGGDNITALSTKVALEQKDAYYVSPAFVGSSTARDEVGALMTAALANADNGDVNALIDGLFKAAIDECEYNG